MSEVVKQNPFSLEAPKKFDSTKFQDMFLHVIEHCKIEKRSFSKVDVILYDEKVEDVMYFEINRENPNFWFKSLKEGLISSVSSGDLRRYFFLTNFRISNEHKKNLLTFFLEGTQKTLLHVAAERGHLEIVKDLVEKHKISPNIRFFDYQTGRAGITALHCAISNDNRKIERYLKKKGAKKNIEFNGVTCKDLEKLRKQFHKKNVEKTSLKKLRELVRKRAAHMLSPKTFRFALKRIGVLAFRKKMNRRMLATKPLTPKSKSKTKEIMKEKLKFSENEVSYLHNENDKLKKMLQVCLGQLNEKLNSIEKKPVGTDKTEPPRVTLKKLAESVREEKKKAPVESRKKNVMEGMMKRKILIKRRLKAASKSNNLKFLKKIVDNFQKSYQKRFKVENMEEFKGILEKIEKLEMEKKKAGEKKSKEIDFSKFDENSIPPVKKKGDGEDVMISSIYAINNSILKEKEDEKMEGEYVLL